MFEQTEAIDLLPTIIKKEAAVENKGASLKNIAEINLSYK